MLESNLQQATYWCMRAAEHKHIQAMRYLKETSFSSEIYVFIAESYEQGKHVKRDMALAVEFYIKATNAGSKTAAFHLGKLYEVGAEDLLTNIEKAYHYYSDAF